MLYDPTRNRVTGVEYLDATGAAHRVEGRVVVLAAHAFETPRLLLLSGHGGSRDGLANSSGLVGRRFMSHPTWQVFGTFDEPINAFKGMQMGHVMVQDYYAPRADAPYRRGLRAALLHDDAGDLRQFERVVLRRASSRTFSTTTPTPRRGGRTPRACRTRDNTVTLDPEVKDARGLPVARLTYAWGENDVTLAAAARDKAGEMMGASGARTVRIGLNYGAHAMGSCRMGDDPSQSVVNGFCQSHDVPNLFVCDTSVFVTGSGLNPTLTAMAIVRRAAGHVADSARRHEL